MPPQQERHADDLDDGNRHYESLPESPCGEPELKEGGHTANTSKEDDGQRAPEQRRIGVQVREADTKVFDYRGEACNAPGTAGVGA